MGTGWFDDESRCAASYPACSLGKKILSVFHASMCFVGASKDVTDKDNKTPLEIAQEHDQEDVVEELMKT